MYETPKLECEAIQPMRRGRSGCQERVWTVQHQQDCAGICGYCKSAYSFGNNLLEGRKREISVEYRVLRQAVDERESLVLESLRDINALRAIRGVFRIVNSERLCIPSPS